LRSVSQHLPVPLLLQPAGGFLKANTSHYFVTVRERSKTFQRVISSFSSRFVCNICSDQCYF
jgi:hypothetical protein